MVTEKHTIFDKRLHVYKRENSRYWQCSAFLDGKNHRRSTNEDSLARAKDIAEDWYLELRGKLKRGELIAEKTFRQAAEQFVYEYEIITEGERNPVYVQGHKIRLEAHLLPFFGDLPLSQVTAGKLQEYRINRKEKAVAKWGRPPARNTIHQEVVTLRQVLKTAIRHKWIGHLPDLSEPYKKSKKVSHRAWFSGEEYQTLFEATRKRADQPKKVRWAWESEQLHDLVLMMGNTGLRPDEVGRLEFRDVSIVDDYDTGRTILEIVVRGKRGVGYCKSMPGAVFPFKRLSQRKRTLKDVDGNVVLEADGLPSMAIPKPTDKIFPTLHTELFNAILGELNLKVDREGNRRTIYSLRHTYICLRLIEGADIYQVAKNCRTSVEMIQKHYAIHLKNQINAAAINVRRRKRSVRTAPKNSEPGK